MKKDFDDRRDPFQLLGQFWLLNSRPIILVLGLEFSSRTAAR